MADPLTTAGRRRRLATLLVASIVAAAGVVAPAEAHHPPAAEFAVDRGGRPLLVTVTLEDREALFFVDTGASKTAFDVRLRPLLGPARGAVWLRTSAGLTRAESFACPEAKLGPLDLRAGGTVVCCDLAPIRAAVGKEVDGILGMDFLRRYAVEADFDAGRLRFWHEPPSSWSSEGDSLPLALGRDGVPYTLVTLPGGRREALLVDTGANACSLKPDAFDLLSAEGELLPADDHLAATIAGEVSGRTGFVRRLAVGEFGHELVRFDRDPIGALGLRYLSRYTLRLDPANECLHLVPGERFSEAERTATSGLALVALQGEKRIHAVKTQSPASAAGLRVGDVVIEIDGRDASTIDLFEIGEILTSRSGRAVGIRVRRPEGEAQATLVLGSRLAEPSAAGRPSHSFSTGVSSLFPHSLQPR